MQGNISAVHKNSLADRAGIQAGWQLIGVNNSSVEDIIDLSFLLSDTEVNLELLDDSGNEHSLLIEKGLDEDLGLEFASAVFDKVRTCHNNCVFCFVDQMRPGLRKSLYVRDDDYRLSFLYGNFITLTNMQGKDYQRIISNHLTPLYVSVHATNGTVRKDMMKNKSSDKILANMHKLADNGIHMHTQIVLCPGYNDGAVLEQTFNDLYAMHESVDTMAVVPVGLTKERNNLTPLRLFTSEEASSIVNVVTQWQKKCRQQIGRSFIYLGDEFYFAAGAELPATEYYDGFPQLENGIGLSRNFLNEWEDAHVITQPLPAASYSVPVGESAAKILAPLLQAFNEKHRTKHKLIPVANSFFGTTINVTGLLTATDILQSFSQELQRTDKVILPGSVLNNDGMFLDDRSLAEFKQALSVPVSVAASAADLKRLLSE